MFLENTSLYTVCSILPIFRPLPPTLELTVTSKEEYVEERKLRLLDLENPVLILSTVFSYFTSFPFRFSTYNELRLLDLNNPFSVLSIVFACSIKSFLLL